MSEVATFSISEEEIAGSAVFSPPSVAVTSPSGAVTTSTVTVTWTYNSVISRPQTQYRVRLLAASSLTEYYDSGFVAGAGTSLAVPFALSSGSSYLVEVTVWDSFAYSDPATSTFTADLDSLAGFADNPAVGSIYEVGVNGVGYMLADNPERPRTLQVGTLQAPRLATGDTPFSEAIERYTMVGQSDWTGGAGQLLGDGGDASPTRYSTSEGVNPFESGELTLINKTLIQNSDNYATPRAAVASGDLFVQTAAAEMTNIPSISGTPAAMTIPNNVVSVTSDGTYWYVATDADTIYRGTGTTVGAVWSDLSTPAAGVSIVEWLSDRLGVVYTDGSGNSVFSTVGPTGTEEVTNGRFEFVGATITAMTSGDGYVWLSVNRTDRSDIYAWQIGAADNTRFIALSLPAGQYATALGFYLGNVMVRAAEVVDGTTTRAIIYRCIPQDGALVPERVMDMEESGVDHSAGSFCGDDRFVFWSWKAMADDGRSGVACLDLSTGGWARWFYAPVDTATGVVQSVFRWANRIGFTIGGYGAVVEDTVPVATGYLETSTRDLSSGLTKVLDDLRVSVKALPVNATVTAAVSVDGGGSFITLGSITGAGLRIGSWEIGRESPSLAYKVTLATTGTVSPTVRIIQGRVHALSVVDEILTLPINCTDELRALNARDIGDAERPALARARVLEALVGTRVRVQDVDWVTTQTTGTWEMVSAETTSVGVMDRAAGHRTEADCVCVITLRRART